MRKIVGLVAVLGLVAMLALCGCAGRGETTPSAALVKPSIDLSQIDWNVSSGVVDGNRAVVFGFTNNTGYDIVDFKLDFRVKGDVTDEQLQQYDELVAKAGDYYELTELTFNCMTQRYVPDGESIDGRVATLNGTIQYFTQFEAYECFEPDILTVAFLSGDKVYAAYYDFESGTTTVDDQSVDAYTWGTGAVAAALPKPEVKVLSVSTDEDDSLFANAYGVTKDDFNAYVEACKGMGFTQNADSGEGSYAWYNAENGDGMKVSVRYFPDDAELVIDADTA